MRVLGISCFYHDAAAALLVDGDLVAAAEEERFSRIKHDFEYPERAIRFCLDTAGITVGDLDLIVFYEKPFWKFDRILMSALQTFPSSLAAFREGMLVWLLDKLWVRDTLHERLGCDRKKIVFAPHHTSHAASAFFASGWDKAAILTVDGVGEWATGTRGTAWDTHIDIQEKMSYPHSVGLLYSAFTAFLGFQVNEGEYKVMGLAPYGQPRFVDVIFDKLVHLHEDGSFWLDMKYFAFHYSAHASFNDRFAALFGKPRTAAESNLLDPHYADIAASIQKVTEEILVRQTSHLHQRTGHDRLCMAGGVALNSVANARVLRESGFKELYIQPAAGDGGGALGAALYGYHELLKQPRKLRMTHAYYGQAHDDAAVADFLKSQGHAYVEMADHNTVCDEVAQRLSHGQVVGWMQGRFEWGPRALGHRSILADPRAAVMKDVVNARIKFREPFRPFAPSVLADHVERYFELPNAERVDPARFMLLVVPVREEHRGNLQAITHVDGTARIQAVHRAESPGYYDVIERFGQATGMNVVLNTSFNLRGEPIVNTPAEAYSTYARSDMDALVMGRFLVSRRPASESRVTPGADLDAWRHAPTVVEPDRGHGLFGVAAVQPEVALSGSERVKQFAGRALLVLLMSLVGCELLLRWFVPMTNLQIGGMYTQGQDGVQLTPGWHGTIQTREFKAPVKIGKDALRDTGAPLQDPKKRIVVLGDSFTFGCWSPAERTWLRRMQAELGSGVEVVNAGQPNSGTDAELAFLRRKGAELKPDVVLLAFFTGNDYLDNYVGRNAYRVEGGYIVMNDDVQRHINGYNCLSGTSQGVQPAARRAGLGTFFRRTALYQFSAALYVALTTPKGTVRLGDAAAWQLKEYRPEMLEAVQKSQQFLEELLVETRTLGVPLGIIVIPSDVEVYPERMKDWASYVEVNGDLFDAEKPTRTIVEWAAAHGVPCLNLRGDLVGRPDLYYKRDMHWNDDGHFQAGLRTADFVRKAGLLK